MNVSANLGSRAKPLIITRINHAVMCAHRAPQPSVGIASARALSSASVTSSAPPLSSPASGQRPPPPSSSPAPSRSATSSSSAAASSSAQHEPSDGGGSDSGSSAPPHPENLSRTSTWVWRTIYLTAAAAGTGLAAQYAYDPTPIRHVGQSLYDGIESRMRLLTEPSRDKLLPDHPKGTYSADMARAPRTLVIDLENTLVHSSYSRATGWRVAKRPAAEAFLAYLASFYELVVFTSNLYTYADPILNKLDPNGYIQHRLYRGETHFQGGVYIKDLSCLNRDLDRVVVIDKDEKCVQKHLDNAIIVPEWKGDPSDTTLLDLIPLLEGIVREDVHDLRDVLRDVSGKPVQEAVMLYRAGAASRAEQANSRPASMFGLGHAPDPQQHSRAEPARHGDAGGDEEKASSGKQEGTTKHSTGLWGALPGGSKLFQGKSANAEVSK